MESMMDTSFIQSQMDNLVGAMLAKGIGSPDASFSVRANDEPQVMVKWKPAISDPYGLTNTKYKWFTGAKALEEASVFVRETMPDATTEKLHDFMKALGSVIDAGNKYGIDTEYLNPLTKTMKRLSENVLTDQREAV